MKLRLVLPIVLTLAVPVSIRLALSEEKSPPHPSDIGTGCGAPVYHEPSEHSDAHQSPRDDLDDQEHAQIVREYWTPERMKNAIPMWVTNY